MQVMPEHTCRQVSHRIQIVVSHHLRFTTGSTGEVHQHGVVVLIDESRTYKLRSLLPFTLPVAEPFGDGFAMICYGDVLLNRGTIGHSQLDLFCDVSIIYTDDSLH